MLLDDASTGSLSAPESEIRVRISWQLIGQLAGVYAAARLAVAFIALASVWLSNGQQSVYGALTKWDSGWYGFIAEKGYPDHVLPEAAGGNRWAFFPGWPALLRITHTVIGGSWQRNGLTWSIILGFATVVLMYLVVADALGGDVAWRATALYMVAPAAAVLSMAYSEVLFIPCCLAVVLFLGRHRWLLAGVAGLVGSATRIAGVALIIVCLVESIAAFRRTRSVRPFIAPLLASLGIASFFVLQRVRAGSWTAYSDAQAYWGNGASVGGPTLRAMRDLLTESAAWDSPVTVLVPIVVAGAIASAWALFRTRNVPRTWWLFIAIVGPMALSASVIYSMPRLLLPLFPIAAGVAARTPRRWFPLIVGGSCVVATVVAILYFNTATFQMAP
jgi:hypothetical protein